MRYKSKETYDSALAVAEMFGAGHLFHQKNSYPGKPGMTKKAPRPKVAPLSPEEVESTYKISTFVSPRDFALCATTDWTKPHFGAKPYLDAMLSLDSFDATYGADDARSICNYFLANANTWRGPVAKAAKAKLKKILAR